MCVCVVSYMNHSRIRTGVYSSSLETYQSVKHSYGENYKQFLNIPSSKVQTHLQHTERHQKREEKKTKQQK